MNYPQYVSHKVVNPVQIESAEACADGGLLVHLKDGFETVKLAHEEATHKPRPLPNWYLVVYEDGYRSFSPQAAFEEGYTRMEPEPEPSGEADELQPVDPLVAAENQEAVALNA